MSKPLPTAALAGCYVISLRPVGGHAALRRAAAKHGARTVALSPWRVVPRDDDATRRALQAALRAAHVVVTSPAAARAAAALAALAARPRGSRPVAWYATGPGTASALRRARVADVVVPVRKDSEGVLALPQLRALRDVDVAILTAPGGRDRLAPALRRRGAVVRRVDVYDRVAVAPSARALATLRALDAPLWLALSSGEALQRVLAALPPDLRARIRTASVTAASARLAALAQDAGFVHVVVAADARPAALLVAAARTGCTPRMKPIR